MYCGECTAVKSDKQAFAAVSLRCRAWTCENCAPIRRSQVKHQARAGRPKLFITLTVKPQPDQTADERARLLADAWPKVIRRALVEAKRDPRRKPVPSGPTLDPKRARARSGVYPRQVRLTEERLPFFAVFERTRDGEPHLHILARAEWIGQEWLSVQMRELIGAPIVWVKKIDSASMLGAYVTKYIGKDPHIFVGCKRYWRSLRWFIEEAKQAAVTWLDGRDWQLVREPINAVLHGMLQKGWRRIEWRGRVAWMFPCGP